MPDYTRLQDGGELDMLEKRVGLLQIRHF